MPTSYWFKFAQSKKPEVLNLGCGITAHDAEDAKNLLVEKVFAVYQPREILEITEVTSLSQLDAGHVLPNMKPLHARGVWFPLLPE